MQIVLPWEGLRVFEVLFGISIESGKVQARRASQPARSVSFARPPHAHAILIDDEGRTLTFTFEKATGIDEYSLEVICASAPNNVEQGIPPQIELRLWLLSRNFSGVRERDDRDFRYQIGVQHIAVYLRDSRKFIGLREDGKVLSFLRDSRMASVAAYIVEGGLADELKTCGLISTAQRQALDQAADGSEFEHTDGVARFSPFAKKVPQPDVDTLHDTDDDGTVILVGDEFEIEELPLEEVGANHGPPEARRPSDVVVGAAPRPQTQTITRRHPRTGEIVAVDEAPRAHTGNGKQ